MIALFAESSKSCGGALAAAAATPAASSVVALLWRFVSLQHQGDITNQLGFERMSNWVSLPIDSPLLTFQNV
jgi:hypothetical protein